MESMPETVSETGFDLRMNIQIPNVRVIRVRKIECPFCSGWSLHLVIPKPPFHRQE